MGRLSNLRASPAGDRIRRALRQIGPAALLVLCCASAQAGALRFCDRAADPDADQKDRIFRFGAIVKAQLEASGHRLALISRSGLDLQRFGVRYSHSGVSLKAGNGTPWSVRQLYFACDEQRPRIFDQGVSGFLLGMDDPSIGYVSMILLPAEAESALEHSVTDDRRALQLLGANYSANAFPFSLRYQNCNQWLIEMLAAAWGLPGEVDDLRPKAQAWLREQGYRPTTFEKVFPPPAMLASLVSLLHQDDHPREDLENRRIQVSMPSAIEAFVANRLPLATRIELCHNHRQVVIHRGWRPIAEGCEPAPGDEVVSLIDPPG
ncbi:MAG: DUF2145 domain-containing protein [Ideonella sp.]